MSRFSSDGPDIGEMELQDLIVALNDLVAVVKQVFKQPTASGVDPAAAAYSANKGVGHGRVLAGPLGLSSDKLQLTDLETTLASGGSGKKPPGEIATEAATQAEQLVDAATILENAGQQFGEGLSNALADAVLNAEDLGDALEGLAQQMLSDVIRNLIFAPLGDALGGVFGGALAGKKAGGGRIAPMAPVLVGERGPELIMSARPATVMNSADSRHLLSSGGSRPIVQNMTFTSDVKDNVRAEILNTMPAITQNVMQALRNQEKGVR